MDSTHPLVAGSGLAHGPAALRPHATPSPELVLGSALLEVVRQVLQDELRARQAAADTAPKSPWMTPPAAARATRVPLKTIRAWARTGRIPRRLKNRSADPKQQKYLVNVDDVVTVAEQSGSAAGAGGGADPAVRARARALEILATREAKGR